MKIVNSPITGSPATFIVELDRTLIIKTYLKELSIAVDKFLPEDTKISIYACPDTGYRFYYPFNIFADAGFYNLLHQANSKYYEPWKWENKETSNFIASSNYLLDVGCGEGLFLKEMQKKGMKHLYGIDFSVVEELKNEKDGITIENTTIEEFSSRNIEKFDIVTCFQVLEHITDVKLFIESCLRCLKPGGKLIVAVPNCHPYIYINDLYHTLNLPPHHAGLWNKNSLERICGYFPMQLIYSNYQPIGKELLHYSYVQIDYWAKKYILFRYIFRISLFRKLYTKSLHLIKNNIQGHSIIAVYNKK